ncbi:MAG: DUF4280 domain-containing protein [Lachnospiraceae bacterium]|nr:DUF4280 domain-containing protein [Lachnospiraceae bacterium]
MKPIVIQGTLLKCSFGNMPTPIMVMPDKKVNSTLPVAVKSDHVPFLNILPFGMCSNPANPMVAAATAAALGVLTPMPCIPCTAQDWSKACSKVKIGGKEAINMDSCLKCLYGGNIQVVAPLQPTVLIS